MAFVSRCELYIAGGVTLRVQPKTKENRKLERL